MELAKKIIAGFLLLVTAASYLGSIAITAFIVLPAGWYWAVIQWLITAIAGPVCWEFGKRLYLIIFPKK
jgi:hypothetical protein